MKVLLCLLINVFIAFAAPSSGVADDLQLWWPKKYTVKATKITLTSNLVEDFTAWKTSNMSRVDYNHGAVKSIRIIPRKHNSMKFMIRPMTTETVLNKMTCYRKGKKKGHPFKLQSKLPHYTSQYKAIGNETIRDLITTKFEYHDVDDIEETNNTVWAYYNTSNIGNKNVWIPVKYEMKKYSLMFGSLLEHEIWLFSDFGLDFDDKSVWGVIIGVCTRTEEDGHSWNSEIITKDLALIDPENENHVDHVFNNFKTKFQRRYAHEFEHTMRKMIFQKNLRLVQTVNSANLGYTLAINQFSDRTPEELKGSLGALPAPSDLQGTHPFPYDEDQLNQLVKKLPKVYDARIEGLVSPVKNQQTCGSCWTFAAAAVTEAAIAKANGGKMLSFSNQAIIDCAYEGMEKGEGGCDGGFAEDAYKWMMKHGLPTDEEYGPYKNKEDYCHIANMTKIYPIKGYTDVPPFSNNAMKVALVNYGPLFINIHASDKFSAYSSGIFYEGAKTCPRESRKINHAVALVGYGERDGEPFWILKNSWGTSWGMNGYMHISARDSVCGVSSEPSFPIV